MPARTPPGRPDEPVRLGTAPRLLEVLRRSTGSRPPMRFTIRHAEGYLRGDLYYRQTAEETRQFLQALLSEALGSGVDRVLVSVHESRTVFRAEGWGLSDILRSVATRPAHRIAAVADTFEGQLAQRYVAMLARLRGFNVSAFDLEPHAIGWLLAPA